MLFLVALIWVTMRSLKSIGFDHVRRYDKALIVKDDFNDNSYNH